MCESTNASCNKKDKQILICFKHGLTNPLGMLPTWSNKKDCCEWRGVHCNINGRVTNISVPCFTDDEDITIGYKKNKTHCLAGKLHISLFQLEFLKYLNLSNNDFKAIHGPLDFPHKSVNFSNVVHLDLSENENLVISDLRWLLRLSSSLEFLNLNFVDLHKQADLFQILSKLPLLSELHLSSCLLESASPSLLYANFTSLECLDLSYNDFFSELPVWLFNLSGLSYLDLRDNRFHGQLPENLLNSQNLQLLDLRDNMIGGTIPDWIGQLGSLQYLSLYRNLLIGSIPTTLRNLSSLTTFNVASNNLTGSLESLGKLSNLEVLLVGDNYYLSGVLTHRNFTKLYNLKKLYLGSPFFIFDFDPHWIPPFKLQLLDLKYVNLELVSWLYTQTTLTYLFIGSSSFNNTSPKMFWSFVFHFKFLSLYNNSMPWNMSNVLLNSKLVWLIGNGLSGGLPRLTSNVSVLHIGNNNLSGSLSPLICQKMIGKSNLKYLSVSFNRLSGGLTECWGNWKSLIHVELGGNYNPTGRIPHSMGSLSNLMSLHIFNTKLHGEIPASLKNSQKLAIVNLSKNKLSGNIPNWIGNDMKVIQLRSNKFSGDIPLQICQLSSLFVLDLSNNRLTGTIPHCLHNITSMIFNIVTLDKFSISCNFFGVTIDIYVPLLTKGNDLSYSKYMHVVDLSNNQFSGRIPIEVFSLTALQSLNLSQNQLMGTISEEIGNMKQLESLDFSNNTLSGEIPQIMSALSFLEVLNLSFNNLKGQIPLGTQLQGFTPLSYMGNPELCGTPLIEKCKHNEEVVDTNVMKNDDEEGSELMECFYMGMGVGFAISFWIVFGSLLFKRTWRHAYFNFLYDVKDWFMSKWS